MFKMRVAEIRPDQHRRFQIGPTKILALKIREGKFGISFVILLYQFLKAEIKIPRIKTSLAEFSKEKMRPKRPHDEVRTEKQHRQNENETGMTQPGFILEEPPEEINHDGSAEGFPKKHTGQKRV